MTGRTSPVPLGLVALALAAAVGGCRGDRTPRRVPDDGAPCSAIMPGAAKSGEQAIRLGSVAVTERSWVRLPPDVQQRPSQGPHQYVVRRGERAGWVGPADAALLDAAAARAARGIALQDATKPASRRSRPGRATPSSAVGDRHAPQRHPVSRSSLVAIAR